MRCRIKGIAANSAQCNSISRVLYAMMQESGQVGKLQVVVEGMTDLVVKGVPAVDAPLSQLVSNYVNEIQIKEPGYQVEECDDAPIAGASHDARPPRCTPVVLRDNHSLERQVDELQSQLTDAINAADQQKRMYEAEVSKLRQEAAARGVAVTPKTLEESLLLFIHAAVMEPYRSLEVIMSKFDKGIKPGDNLLSYLSQSLGIEGITPKELEALDNPFEKSAYHLANAENYAKARKDLDFLAALKSGQAFKSIPDDLLPQVKPLYEERARKIDEAASRKIIQGYEAARDRITALSVQKEKIENLTQRFLQQQSLLKQLRRDVEVPVYFIEVDDNGTHHLSMVIPKSLYACLAPGLGAASGNAESTLQQNCQLAIYTLKLESREKIKEFIRSSFEAVQQQLCQYEQLGISAKPQCILIGS